MRIHKWNEKVRGEWTLQSKKGSGLGQRRVTDFPQQNRRRRGGVRIVQVRVKEPKACVTINVDNFSVKQEKGNAESEGFRVGCRL